MSVEAPPKMVEEATPVETKPVEQPIDTPAHTETTAPATDKIETAAESTAATTETAAGPEQGLKKNEAVVEAVPASEGVLGYKAPGLLKSFHYSKHFFWFSDEPVSGELLANYIRMESTKTAHDHAAWARESGRGVLFYSKRAEDKANPTGLILLHDVSNTTKEAGERFSFKVGHQVHRFEAPHTADRNSWVVAIEKKVAEAKEMKDDIHGRESYKKNVEEYTKNPAQISAAAAASMKAQRSKSREPATVTETNGTNGVIAPTTNGAKHEEPLAKEEKKEAKSRSQSRKRNSIFGSILGKKEEHKEEKSEDKAEKKAEQDAKKEAKSEEKVEKKAEHDASKEDKAEHKAEKEQVKEEKKAEKEHVKEEKKVEAEQKKEEAKATHDSSKATEAAEAAAVAAVPAAAVAAEKKHEKKEEKKEEKKVDGATTPTDKKAKRGSVFGSLFAKKSPVAEKSEKEVGPEVPAKDAEVLPVSETAPVIDEPIDTKPIDTAAVTAPIGQITTNEPKTEETATPAPAAPAATEKTTTPKQEKKSFLAGFINKKEAKKEEHKEDKREEKVAETTPTETTAIPATTEATEPTNTEAPAAKEERPAREKRRSSFFSGLGTLKKKNNTKEETAAESSDKESPLETNGTKREKSPLPTKIGGLFRKPSKAVKPTEPAKTEETTPTTETTAAPTAADVPATTTETAPTSTVPGATDSKIVGDVVPDDLHATNHDKVTTSPEVSATT